MSILPLLLAFTTSPQTSPPQMSREFRGVWVATVANIDWPSKSGLPSQQQQDELVAIMDKAAALNLNAIILQIRPSADALYDSPIEPWSEYLTGQQGKPPNPYWDPLSFAVALAHKRGLELHCWFNPYRAYHPAQKGPLASRHISRLNPRIVKSYGKYLWLDPGEPETRKETLSVIMDVVRRYDIDGVHIDDYFYPYKEKGPDGQNVDFPDGPSWSRYVSGGGKLSKGDWRRRNVDDFIRSLYESIKKDKPWVKFGISPFGIYRPGVPAGIAAGVDQYADLYADARKWLVNGWCDYYAPQLYWPIKQTAQSYPVLLDWWMKQNPKGRHIWPGNYTSRTMPAEGNWQPQEVVDQIRATRDAGAGGNIHFSMKAFSTDARGVATTLRRSVYAKKALVPASPWLDSTAPKAPMLSLKAADGETTVTARANGDKDIRFYVWSVCTDGEWQAPTVTSDDSLVVRSNAGSIQVSCVAVDRAENSSPASEVKLPASIR
jgi:uncharacterized lipoprotein YddW (UPF0748 family)